MWNDKSKLNIELRFTQSIIHKCTKQWALADVWTRKSELWNLKNRKNTIYGMLCFFVVAICVEYRCCIPQCMFPVNSIQSLLFILFSTTTCILSVCEWPSSAGAVWMLQRNLVLIQMQKLVHVPRQSLEEAYGVESGKDNFKKIALITIKGNNKTDQL